MGVSVTLGSPMKTGAPFQKFPAPAKKNARE